jgi:dTDP-4-amino-4,6-dideoxygalactose transaminase
VLDVARRHGLRVVEDAAQGVNAFYRGRALGSLGAVGTYSFHETKNYSCGEGGAICLNDPALVARAEILRDKGTNRKQFLRGEVDKYTWVDVGSSYVPSEICSAFLFAQLELLDVIRERRLALFEYYQNGLAALEDDGLLRLPRRPDECRSNFHLFYVLLPDEATRNGLMAHLKEQGILAVFHYVPLHTSPVGRSFGYGDGDLPVTESHSARLLRLPMYNDLTEAEQARVVAQITRYLRRVPTHCVAPAGLFAGAPTAEGVTHA